MKNIRKNLTVVLSIVMSVVICLVTMGSTPAETYTAYIDPELKEMFSGKVTELIPVDIWLYDVDMEKVEAKAAEKTGIKAEIFNDEKAADALTSEQVDSYISAKRAIYAEIQAKSSKAFMEKYANIFESKNFKEDGLFVSEYSPVIRLKISAKQLSTFSKDTLVQAIYYSPDIELQDELANSVETIRADYLRDNLNLTGNGIRIGLLESDGMPKKESAYFNISNIIYDPYFSNPETTTHATKVTEIMIGKSIGIIPDAKIYATYVKGVNWRERVEWLISQGVHVINMSAGVAYPIGNYDVNCLWADHIAINHSVHFVKSAGNQHNYYNPDNYVTSPGLAFNVITVGNLDDKNNPEYSGDEIAIDSSYKESSGVATPRKPDLVAPGTKITTSTCTKSGTSYAAPQVAAVVAQICQSRPTMRTKPEAMKAILAAGIKHSVHKYVPKDANYDIYGAGMIDARCAAHQPINSQYTTSYFSAAAEDDSSHYYTLTISSKGQKRRVALSWLKYEYLSGSTHLNDPTARIISDLDLYIYDSQGNSVASSNVSKGNVEIANVSTLPAGTYTIEVYLYENGDSKTFYGLSWY